MSPTRREARTDVEAAETPRAGLPGVAEETYESIQAILERYQGEAKAGSPLRSDDADPRLGTLPSGARPFQWGRAAAEYAMMVAMSQLRSFGHLLGEGHVHGAVATARSCLETSARVTWLV